MTQKALRHSRAVRVRMSIINQKVESTNEAIRKLAKR